MNPFLAHRGSMGFTSVLYVKTPRTHRTMPASIQPDLDKYGRISFSNPGKIPVPACAEMETKCHQANMRLSNVALGACMSEDRYFTSCGRG